VLTVLAFHVTIAANKVLGIIGLGTTATSVVVVLCMNLAAAADVGGLVVGIVTTAAGFIIVIFTFQIAIATDVFAEVVGFTITAALPILVVDLIATATTVCQAILVVDEFAVTTEMRVSVVGQFAAAAVPVVVRCFRIETSTNTFLVSVVVDGTATTTRVFAVAFVKYAESVVIRWNWD